MYADGSLSVAVSTFRFEPRMWCLVLGAVTTRLLVVGYEVHGAVWSVWHSVGLAQFEPRTSILEHGRGSMATEPREYPLAVFSGSRTAPGV